MGKFGDTRWILAFPVCVLSHGFWKQDKQTDPLVPWSHAPTLGVHQRRHECKTSHSFFSEFGVSFGEGHKSKELPEEPAWGKKIRAGLVAGEGDVPRPRPLVSSGSRIRKVLNTLFKSTFWVGIPRPALFIRCCLMGFLEHGEPLIDNFWWRQSQKEKEVFPLPLKVWKSRQSPKNSGKPFPRACSEKMWDSSPALILAADAICNKGLFKVIWVSEKCNHMLWKKKYL